MIGSAKEPSHFVSFSCGFEEFVIEELEKTPGITLIEQRAPGIISFSCSTSLTVLLGLRSFDFLYAFLAFSSHLPADASALNCVENLPEQVAWTQALALWKESLAGDITGETPTFRASCDRKGKHAYSSVDISGFLGAGVEKKLGWKVNLKKFDAEIYADITERVLILGIALTKDGMPSRHQKARVVTSLRPSVAYSMLRSIAFSPFDILADPLCGCGTIPLEAASLASSGVYRTFCIGGDASPDAVAKAAQNSKGSQVDILSWDVTRLPLRNACLDLIVSDLPFGNLCGSRRHNQKMYPRALAEFHRVLRPAGRCALLTAERKMILRLIGLSNGKWLLKREIKVRMSGLPCSLFLLLRHEPNSSDLTPAPAAIEVEKEEEEAEKETGKVL